MCVRRFDDSLNSAIHNTLSRFATVFIDARAKGSTVGSCISNFQCLKIAKTKHNTPIRQKSFVSCPPKEGLKLPRGGNGTVHTGGNDVKQEPSGPRFPSHRLPPPKRSVRGRGSKKRGNIDQKLATVMILPQVHLRKPCYDFYFL